ncbi:hypothetical protein F5Y10DRAFT_252027 [Nemania abortiva]|nr:hypothetical protein F5Y10DRAFT_252027 [Nemania abortiva]
MAPLCRFFSQGFCRNGANCRFEHPGTPTNANSFAKPQDGTNPYKLSKEMLKIDLAEERPSWILSCYGPGKDAPEQMFGGHPREQSLEEVMVYIRGSANQQQAISEVTGLYNQAEQQIRAILGNLDGAIDFILAAENNQPNRIDICRQNTLPGGTTGVFSKTNFGDATTNTNVNQNPFSTNTQPNPFSSGGGGGGGPTFGQPSTLGQKPNPFGPPAAPQFGQPSQMGAAAPAFGQPSQMGAAAPAFGQPSQMGASAPAFGQPSAMGQRPNPFSAPSAAAPSPFSNVGQPTFGQPSTMGQTANPFGAPAAAPANPFSQPSAPASGASPFALVSGGANSSASPFGQPAASNPFAQPAASKDVSMDASTPGPAPNNPFGQPPSTSAGFGPQIQPPTVNPGTGFPAATSSPFGAPQKPAHPLQNVLNQAPQNAGVKPGPYAPGSAKQHPPPESYISKAANGQITAFRGRPVVYKWKVGDRYQDQAPENPTLDQQIPGFRKPDGSWCKILFPNGPPSYNKDTEPEASRYTDKIKEAYFQMATTGRFQGDIPEVPPMREDCIWMF